MLTRRDDLAPRLDETTRTWLDQTLTDAADHPSTDSWERGFARAGRHCGAELADPVRVLILHTARPGITTLTRLYEHGSAAERRAVLLALAHLDSISPPDAGLPLIHDALRTHDIRLVAAAVGDYGGRHLDAHAWRHAVLKCLFTDVPLTTVAQLEERAHGDRELARMLLDYADERTAAGRAVPPDLPRLLTLTGEPPEES
ncbi:EboA domain-containing protein [Streptomyces sp. NPDC057638]|uniref:EboA domain-containing protein n=1 Tax=Streptomyces sp. NPDC057638 TaxID=3346190 RepID=UPI0036CF76C4